MEVMGPNLSCYHASQTGRHQKRRKQCYETGTARLRSGAGFPAGGSDYHSRPAVTVHYQYDRLVRRAAQAGRQPPCLEPRRRQRRHRHSDGQHGVHRHGRVGAELINDSLGKQRAAGKDLGRRWQQFRHSQIQNARRLVDGGEQATRVAKDLGMSRATLYRPIHELS